MAPLFYSLIKIYKMKLEEVSRKKAKIKLALQGPSGSGKSLSSLFIAYGLCSNWNNIAVIDSENGSANLYAKEGRFYTLLRLLFLFLVCRI